MVAITARKVLAYVITLIFFLTAALALLQGASTLAAFLKAGVTCLVCTVLALALLKLVEDAMARAAEAARAERQTAVSSAATPLIGNNHDQSTV